MDLVGLGGWFLRAAWGWPDLEFVHVNEVKGGAKTAAHLLKFDSVHGRWQPDVEAAGDDRFLIDQQALSFSEYKTPDEVPWEELGIDMVLECSGQFRTPELLAAYFKRGVKKGDCGSACEARCSEYCHGN